jgi:hypothetical protein
MPYEDESKLSPSEPVTWLTWKRVIGSYWNSLHKQIRELSGLGVRMGPGEDLTKNPGQRPAGDGISKWIAYRIPREEASQLFGLLMRIFKYSPDKRLSIKQMMAEPWLFGRFPSAEIRDFGMDVAVEDRFPK